MIGEGHFHVTVPVWPQILYIIPSGVVGQYEQGLSNWIWAHCLDLKSISPLKPTNHPHF